jgi:hypothetical protein
MSKSSPKKRYTQLVEWLSTYAPSPKFKNKNKNKKESRLSYYSKKK